MWVPPLRGKPECKHEALPTRTHTLFQHCFLRLRHITRVSLQLHAGVTLLLALAGKSVVLTHRDQQDDHGKHDAASWAEHGLEH